MDIIVNINWMGLQQNIQKQLGIPLLPIIKTYTKSHPEQKLCLTDIFNAQNFYRLIVKFTPELVPLQASSTSSDNMENIETKKDYSKIWDTLKHISAQLDIDLHKEHYPMENFMNKWAILFQEEPIGEEVWDGLRILCRVLFRIMLKNEDVLFLLTQMQQKHQVLLKEYIEQNQDLITTPKQHESPLSKSLQKSSTTSFYQPQTPNTQYFLSQIEELEQALQTKDSQSTKLKQKNLEYKEEIANVKMILLDREMQIQGLKKRVEMYSEAEVLFQQKDEQISKLTQQLTQTKLKLHIKTTQLSSELSKSKSKISQLQQQKSYQTHQIEQLASKLQQAQQHKQQSESVNKKVINNLKQRIKSLNDKISEQQKNIIQVLTEKEDREKQFYQLEKKIGEGLAVGKGKFVARFQDMKSSARKSSKLVDQIGDFSHLLDSTEDQLRYYQALFGDMEGRCTGQLCIALRSQYVKLFQQILHLTKDLDVLSYITPQSRLQCILKQLQKLQQYLQQNLKLKQKILLLQSESGKVQSNKEMLQQINKMKKKLLIMKRNMEELENKRKEEIQVLISAYAESVNTGKGIGK